LTKLQKVVIAYGMQHEAHICRRNKCREKGCCKDNYKKYLSISGGRLTKERILLLDMMCNYGSHFTPEELRKALADQGYSMAITTIYRNLPSLEDTGIIRRTTFAEESERGASTFEHIWCRPHHDHLLCQRCGRKIEFQYEAIEVLQEEVARKYGFNLVTHHMELVGLCPECQTDEPESITKDSN
jgi:Fur family transcriptional regulator, ferric uptake regulator